MLDEIIHFLVLIASMKEAESNGMYYVVSWAQGDWSVDPT